MTIHAAEPDDLLVPAGPVPPGWAGAAPIADATADPTATPGNAALVRARERTGALSPAAPGADRGIDLFLAEPGSALPPLMTGGGNLTAPATASPGQPWTEPSPAVPKLGGAASVQGMATRSALALIAPVLDDLQVPAPIRPLVLSAVRTLLNDGIQKVIEGATGPLAGNREALTAFRKVAKAALNVEIPL